MIYDFKTHDALRQVLDCGVALRLPPHSKTLSRSKPNFSFYSAGAPVFGSGGSRFNNSHKSVGLPSAVVGM